MNTFRVKPWVEDHNEWLREFKTNSGHFAAFVYPSSRVDLDADSNAWEWSATRHDEDDRETSACEEREWIERGTVMSAEEGRQLADAVLRRVGYMLAETTDVTNLPKGVD